MSAEIRFDDERTTVTSGQRFRCPDCGSEIEVVFPTPIRHPNQVFRCCGKDMVPTTPPET
jgi:transposase-like protein